MPNSVVHRPRIRVTENMHCKRLVSSLDMDTHLKVRMLKSLNDRYTSFGTKCEAFFQKVNCLHRRCAE